MKSLKKITLAATLPILMMAGASANSAFHPQKENLSIAPLLSLESMNEEGINGETYLSSMGALAVANFR